ncbi:CMGC/CDK protein kinase [Anncaliia algerae PRA339]|uniref:CMGC/CDK protein kinase n=1 Tax=Anncaliia algerae PRA339 TaxID=1288291 RepID=A0A059F649_9MICR|nr:CMGC/CDK protein kinase [Anncaliia algerae PRA339]
MDVSEEGELLTVPMLPIKITEWIHPFIKKLGEGTFGTVYLSEKNNKLYALKSLNLDEEHKNGIPLTIFRELRILRNLNHKNILEIKEIATQGFKKSNFDRRKLKIFFVFDYFKFDLERLIKRKELNLGEIKEIFKQIVDGMCYLRDKNILHRDLKTANILVDECYNIKIADFGLAKYRNPEYNTPGVVTLWYRAPEILLNSTEYDFSSDVWSLGCIFAEMLLRKPIFQGNCVLTQLESIIYVLGSINDKSYPGVNKLPDFDKILLPQSVNHFDDILENVDTHACTLLKKLLVLDPKKRISVKEVLNDKFFN